MRNSLGLSFTKNFLGNTPDWYKFTIIAFLIINPVVFFGLDAIGFNGHYVAGWLLVIEFIFTLAMALKCYPLQPGGLLAIEAVAIGMANPEQVFNEIINNAQVLMLVIFMVAGIFFMKNLLLLIFTKILLKIENKRAISLVFCLVAAILSAFLDALTVTAVLITAVMGFYSVYHKMASGNQHVDDADHDHEQDVHEKHRKDLEQFRAYLRSLLMHGAIGTALGGVCTMVGEPQNLKIATEVGWDFITFFLKMAPVSIPVLIAGLTTCYLLEKLKWFGYGAELPVSIRQTLVDHANKQADNKTNNSKAELIVEGIVACILVTALAFHWAAVGLIGLMIIILLTAFNGIIEEHRIGNAFIEALPFTALLTVFFAVIAVIHEQHLFKGVVDYVLALDLSQQPGMFFIANGVLSSISDNVFVATIYINEVKAAFLANTISREHFETLAIAINAGTNLPSVATPNGQAAFLFLLTSAISPLIRLSYLRMTLMALPYAIVLSVGGYIALVSSLPY